MDRWVGKVALVTGASAGIGARIARALAEKGMRVIAIARRLDKLQELATNLKHEFKAEVHPMVCDVRKEEDILKVFKWAEMEWGGIDVLINNAGILVPETIIGGSTETYRNVMDVNVIAVAICSRELVQSVRKRKSSGHIININSLIRYTEEISMPIGLYCASKYAVTGISKTLCDEIRAAEIDVKVTNISPGAVETDLLRFSLPEQILKELPMLQDTDIADATIHALSTPQHIQIVDVLISPRELISNSTNSSMHNL